MTLIYRHAERGNVLIYILIAVALIAALTYTVSRGSRGNTSTLTDQQAKLAAQEIIDYGNDVATAVQKLRLRGCSDTQISFENDIVTGYANPNAPSDNSCHVFDIAGGALSLPDPPAPFANTGVNFFDGKYSFIHAVEWNGVGQTCASPECVDLIMLMFPLNQSVCNQINTALGYNTDLRDTNLSGAQFQGTYLYNSTIADELTGLNASNKNSACFFRTSDNSFTYAQVLIAR